MELVIRAARESDLSEIVRIQKHSLPLAYGFLDADALDPWLNGDLIERYVDEKWRQMIVAELSDGLVGFAALEGPLIDLLWVRDERRGQGIGSALMDWIEPRIATEHEMAELECFEPNHSAMRFYAKRGYQSTRRYLEPLAGVNKAVLRKRVRA